MLFWIRYAKLTNICVTETGFDDPREITSRSSGNIIYAPNGGHHHVAGASGLGVGGGVGGGEGGVIPDYDVTSVSSAAAATSSGGGGTKFRRNNTSSRCVNNSSLESCRGRSLPVAEARTPSLVETGGWREWVVERRRWRERRRKL